VEEDSLRKKLVRGGTKHWDGGKLAARAIALLYYLQQPWRKLDSALKKLADPLAYATGGSASKDRGSGPA